MSKGIQIRPICESDKKFWFSLDKHLPEKQFDIKVRDGQGYLLSVENNPAAILRYNLFWDNTPFCTLLYVHPEYRRKGYGKMLMQHWENEMKATGYDFLLTSTQSDEQAQNFYRAVGYKDCGSIIVPEQAAELILSKQI